MSERRRHNKAECWCGIDHSRRRVRMALSGGAYMDVCVSPNASQEALDALKALGEAAAKQMAEAAPAPSVGDTKDPAE